MSLKVLDTCSQNLIPYFAHNHCVLLCVWISFQGNLQKESLEMKKKKRNMIDLKIGYQEFFLFITQFKNT